MTEKLMPCPFCGGAAVRKADPGVVNVPFGLVVDHAPGCFLAMPFCTDDEAIDRAWNTRHPTPAADEVEAVARVIHRALFPATYTAYGDYWQKLSDGGREKWFHVARAAIAAMQAKSAEPAREEVSGDLAAMASDMRVMICNYRSKSMRERVFPDSHLDGIEAFVSAAMNPKPADDAEQRLRMIVSHATGGNLQYDPAMSVNAICCEITAMRNKVWQHAQEALMDSLTPRPAEPAGEEPVAFVCEADLRALATKPDGDDMSISPVPRPEIGMNMPLYARPAPSNPERLVDALRQCLDQFAFYAREHTASGKHEKAATNQRFADLASAALSAAPIKTPAEGAQ
jgi:hypothetical protein